MSMRIGPSLAIGGYDKIPFQPQSLGSALVAWWDPEYGVTKDSVSNRVSAWADRVSGTTVVQATGSRQPLWVAASANMNSRASLQMTAAGQTLRIASAPVALRVQQGPSTYLTVVRPASVANNDILGSDGASVAGSFLHLIFSTKINAAIYVAGGVAKFQGGLTTMLTNTKYMTGQMNDGTSIFPLLNGVKDNVGAATGTTTTPTAPFVIGARTDGFSTSFQGFMGDVFILNRALTDAELAKMYLWAKERWGL